MRKMHLMLKTFRRHIKNCVLRAKGRNARNCRCPIWVDGMLVEKRILKSLDMRDWQKAQETIRDWEIEGAPVKEELKQHAVEHCVDEFMADAKARGLREPTLKKYRVLLENVRENKIATHSPSLIEFCAGKGLRFVEQLDLSWLKQFRAQWADKNIASQKKLERLRAFGRFATDHGWWPENYPQKIKAPTVTDAPTMPFTIDEVTRLLAACNDYAGEAARLRAFVLLLRYSALRVGDAATCPVDRLEGDRLFLYTHKTKIPVYTVLPSLVVQALEACPRVSDRYWFWTGEGSPETATGNCRRSFRKLARRAGIKGAHPHRFRDTFAVELLLAGIPIERVSVLLGHASVKVTEKHYAPWVQARQAQIEADLKRAWNLDPIALEHDTPLIHGKSEVN